MKPIALSGHEKHGFKQICKGPIFVAHLDQCLIQLRPIYYSTRNTENPSMTLKDSLTEVLKYLTMIASRLGHCISITNKTHYSFLYDEKDRQILLKSKRSLFTATNRNVSNSINDIADKDVQTIVETWGSYNEKLYEKLLTIMYPFLSNFIVKNAYIFDLQLSNFSDVTTIRMKLLRKKFNFQYMSSSEQILSVNVDYPNKTICDLPPCQYSFSTRLRESSFPI